MAYPSDDPFSSESPVLNIPGLAPALGGIGDFVIGGLTGRSPGLYQKAAEATEGFPLLGGDETGTIGHIPLPSSEQVSSGLNRMALALEAFGSGYAGQTPLYAKLAEQQQTMALKRQELLRQQQAEQDKRDDAMLARASEFAAAGNDEGLKRLGKVASPLVQSLIKTMGPNLSRIDQYKGALVEELGSPEDATSFLDSLKKMPKADQEATLKEWIPRLDNRLTMKRHSQELEMLLKKPKESLTDADLQRFNELNTERTKRAADLEKAKLDFEKAQAEMQGLPVKQAQNVANMNKTYLEMQKIEQELSGVKTEDEIQKMIDPRVLAAKERVARAGAPKNQIILPEQEKEFEKEMGKQQAQAVLASRKGAEEAAEMLTIIKEGRALIKSGIITGFGAEAIVGIGQMAKQLGFNVGDHVANSQAFASTMAQNVGKLIKQFGSGAGLSNADREYAEKMAGGKITLDEKAIVKILDINERGAKAVLQKHNKLVAGKKTQIPLTVDDPTMSGWAIKPIK